MSLASISRISYFFIFEAISIAFSTVLFILSVYDYDVDLVKSISSDLIKFIIWLNFFVTSVIYLS